MQIPAYERDATLTELHTTVLDTGVESGTPFAVLDDTILYPEGGGQPADRGRIGDVAVLDVQKRGGATRHYLARPIPPGPVVVTLDWARRFDHMQQHTGQHLLTAVAQDRFRWETTSFHLGESTCDIELAVASPTEADLARLEDEVAAEIRAARPVTARRVSQAEYPTLNVRSRGLPEGFEGDVRLVEIAGADLNTCGGTHLRSTAEIEALKLLGTESIRGGVRLSFVAGGRVRRRLGAHEARTAALRALLGASDAELVATAGLKLDQLRAAERRLKDADEEIAASIVASLAAEAGPVVSRHLESRDMAFVQRLGRAFVLAAPARAALLTAPGLFVLAAGDAVPLDVAAAGREIAALLDGKGGGSGRVFQGKAASAESRDARAAAVARLEALVQAG